MDNDEIEIDLLRTIKALLKKVWLIVLVAVICGGAMLGYGKYSYTPSYTASTILFIRYTNSRAVLMGENEGTISYNSVDEARKLVSTSVAVLKTNSTLEEVATRSGLDLKAKDISGKISASSVSGTELLKVSVTSSNAQEAMVLANTIGQVLPEQMEKVNNSCVLEVMDEATLPEDTGTSTTKKNTLMAAVCGAFVVCAVVAMVDIVAQVKEASAQKKKQGKG